MKMLATIAACLLAVAPPGSSDETDTSKPTEESRRIVWLRDFQKAVDLGKKTERPLLVDFEAEWCGWCKKLDRETYSDEKVIRLVREHFVAVKVDTDKHPELRERFEVSGLPTILFLSPGGEELQRLTGFRPAARFLDEAGKSVRSAASLGKLKAAAASSPGDIAAQRAYARALFAAGNTAEAGAVLEAALKTSPEHSGAMLDLADVLLAGRRLGEARALYEKILRAAPGGDSDERDRACLPLARILIGLKEHREATRVLGKYLDKPARDEDTRPRLEALFLRGYAHAVLDDADSAVADLKAAVDLDPTGEWGLRAAGILDLIEAE